MNRLGLLKEDARRGLGGGVPFSMLDGKRILITGASGIIGTHFLYGLLHCQKHLGLQMEVVGVARRGVPEHLFPMGRQASFWIGDLAKNRFLNKLPRADIIIHAAGYGQPALFMANAEATLKLNTATIFGLLEKLRPGGKFLFLSTSEVYSGLTQTPFSEDQIGTTNTAHPRSCYIEAKRCGEAICNAYRARGVAAKSARQCLAYGPGTRAGDKRVLYAFIRKALQEKAIHLLDQGEAKRTYCYIADAVYMLWRILLEGKQAIYNVGGISRTTILELAQLIGKQLNVPIFTPTPLQPGGVAGAPSDVRLNLDKFTSEFGPVDFMGLEEGVARTIAWQRSLDEAIRGVDHRRA